MGRRKRKSSQIKPSPAASSSPYRSSPAPNHGSQSAPQAPSTSVNELLDHLRRTQISQPRDHPHEDGNPHPTVHPSLNEILQIPETPTPRPRWNPLRRRLGGPAGPPPPISWLVYSVQASKGPGNGSASGNHNVVILRRLDRLPGIQLPNQHSLLHQSMKALAKHWRWHQNYDQEYLSTLQQRHKVCLLAYIAAYSPSPLTRSGLDILFPQSHSHKVPKGSNGSIKTTESPPTEMHLDLSGTLLKDLTAFLSAGQITDPSASESTVPDSWDLQPPPTPPHLALSRFLSLTHLSLAHVSQPSWRALLSALPYFVSLTHLSLAYWPAPTLTPNSLNASITTSSSIPDFPYSASDVYTSGSGVWIEASSILRRLSKGTICLKWLDLEGCTEWCDALVYQPVAEEEEKRPDAGGVDWLGPWRSVRTIRLNQSWIPTSLLEGTDESPRTLANDDPRCRWRTLLGQNNPYWAPEKTDDWPGNCDVEDESRKYHESLEVRRWIAREIVARMVDRMLRQHRISARLGVAEVETTKVDDWVGNMIWDLDQRLVTAGKDLMDIRRFAAGAGGDVGNYI